jgi:hypothetical protein
MTEPTATRYRKKPVTVDTVQWTGSNLDELIDFTGGDFLLVNADEGGFAPDITAKVYDKLHDTWVGVKTGQRIICGVQGEFYPIDLDVLAETYELADVESAVDDAAARVTSLYERWVKAGPPPLGASMARWWDARLVELQDAIRSAVPAPTPGQDALRDRIAEALAAVDGWEWTPDFDKTLSPVWQGYLKRANAVLAKLPAPADRAAVPLGAAELSEHPRLNVTPLPAEALAADEVFVDPAAFRAAVLREAADGLDARAAEFTAAARKDPLAFVKGATDARYRTADAWNAAAAELRRMAAESAPADTGHDEAEIVAYRNPDNPRTLLCREHGPRYVGMVPVTSEELPDGGICTFGRLSSLACERDVLIPPTAAAQPKEARP